MHFRAISNIGSTEKRNDGCHVIVCGNEKGGSGKSTVSMHLAVGLQRLGFRTATLDLDLRQLSLTHYQVNRREFMVQSGMQQPTPAHIIIEHADTSGAMDANTAIMFDHGLWPLLDDYDFLVVDTPGSYSPLSAHMHGLADTLITPVNDSFVDFDVLARIDPITLRVKNLAQYALAVREARRKRQQSGQGMIDWIVVRNRLSQLSSHNEQRVYTCLSALGVQLGYRLADGIGERTIYRSMFHYGLTALDALPDMHDNAISRSHLSARAEVSRLISNLGLPINEVGRRRQQQRKRWLNGQRNEIKLPDIFA